jgi:hypothetical protein
MNMKNYNLVYDKSADLEKLTEDLVNLGITINHTFTSLGIINITSESENFTEVPGIIGYGEDISIEPDAAAEWHQLRVGSTTLPMKSTFIPKNLGTDISIYLVDSGIYHNHSEFENTNIVDLYSYNDTFDDEIGHGTSIASVIVGKTLGIATEAILKNVKIPMGQSIPLSSLLEAFNAIAADKPSDEFAVINCSWTIPKSMILDNLVAELRSQGFLVVAAAGNTISNADDLSPVGYDAVLGVGASDAFDRVISWAPGAGSNWGKEVDLFAPGIDVTVATKIGGTIETSGTSIAAGIVSSIAAQYIFDIKEQNISNITVEDIQQSILGYAVPDVLFRNETIYEDTPNKLIMALLLTKYYKNDIPAVIKIQPGETYRIPFEINEMYVSAINIDEILFGNRIMHHPSWISLESTTNTITINPPVNEENKNYKIFIEFLGHDGYQLMVYGINFTIGDVPDEYQDELYLWHIEDGDIILVNAASGCGSGDCTGFGSDCLSRQPIIKGATSCKCTYVSGYCYSI